MRFDFRNFAAVDAGSSLFPRDRSVSPTMAPHSMASPSRVMILPAAVARAHARIASHLAARLAGSSGTANVTAMTGNPHDRLEILPGGDGIEDGRQ